LNNTERQVELSENDILDARNLETESENSYQHFKNSLRVKPIWMDDDYGMMFFAENDDIRWRNLLNNWSLSRSDLMWTLTKAIKDGKWIFKENLKLPRLESFINMTVTDMFLIGKYVT
jgi:hypothetical protein